MSDFKSVLAADLKSNTGGEGLKATIIGWLLSPGFATIALHRVAAHVRKRGHKRTADLLWRWNVSRSGCHFHLDSTIAPGLTLPHPTGIVIGAGAVVGQNVTLYQGVTLGRALSAPNYPTLESHVTIYPNTVVVGGITVGESAIIGAQSLVSKDVPPRTVSGGAPSRVLRTFTPD